MHVLLVSIPTSTAVPNTIDFIVRSSYVHHQNKNKYIYYYERLSHDDASHLGLHPFFIVGSNILFLVVIYLFDLSYLSKCLNHSGSPCKMINNRPVFMRPAIGCSGCRE